MARQYKFGEFTLDESRYRLKRGDRVLPLEKRPMELMFLLVERPGELVTREGIAERLWGKDVFVDLDHSINTAVRKIRQALRDDPDKPRFLETVVGKGYRFVAPVVCTGGGSRSLAEIRDIFASPAHSDQMTEPESHSVATSVESPLAVPGAKRSGARRKWLWMAIVGVVAAFVGAVVTAWVPPTSVVMVEEVTQLSDNELAKDNLQTDGVRVYFNEIRRDKVELAQVSVAGGSVASIPTTLNGMLVAGIATDGSFLLAVQDVGELPYRPLWEVPLPAGEPRRMGNLIGQWGSVTPDGRILIGRLGDLFITDKDGTNPRKILTLKQGWVGEPSMSPDGQRIVFTRYPSPGDPELYVTNSDGSGVGLLAKSPVPGGFCDARWTPDGRYVIFASRNLFRQDLWYLRMERGWLQPPGNPKRLSGSPMAFMHPTPSRDGKTIFAVGTKRRAELLRFDMESRQPVPFDFGVPAFEPTYSRDGQWVAYTSQPDHSLWRSRSDGTERLQLTHPPVEVTFAFISPDGKRVAYQTTDGQGTYLVSTDGSPPQKILNFASNAANWSPDGNLLVFNDMTNGLTTGEVKLLDLRTGKISLVPGGQVGPQWAAAGKFIAATRDLLHFQIYDLATGRWSDLAGLETGPLRGWARSPDYKYFYYTTGSDDPKLCRIRMADLKSEIIVSLRDLNLPGGTEANTGFSVAPDNSPILSREIGTREIYALKVKWP
jgi:DNA-binding winged helix-turn-helix (wHTH) protein/Tol biopolymer transport system component